MKNRLLLLIFICLQVNIGLSEQPDSANNVNGQQTLQRARRVAERDIKLLINESVLQEASDIATKLSTLCPPSTCKIIGLGSSPALLMAYMKALNSNSAINLPVSDFRNSPYQKKWLFTQEGDERLSPYEKNLLFDYFDNFLFSQISDNTKQIVLVDFSNSGRSLFAMHSYLELYLNERKTKQLKITSAPLLDAKNKKSILKVGKEHFHITNVAPIEIDTESQFFINMFKSLYDYYHNYTEYGSYRITNKKRNRKVTEAADLGKRWPQKNTSIHRSLFIETINAHAKANSCKANLL